MCTVLTQFIPESFREGTAWWSKAVYTMIQETEIKELRLGVHNPLKDTPPLPKTFL